MNVFLITFSGEVDTKLLDKYNAKNIETLNNIKHVAICQMTNDNAEKLTNDEYEHVLAVEKEEEIDIDDGDTDDNQQVSYALPLMEVEEFHSRGYKGKGV